jgi:L-lactate dehydrogenase complex protein LldG
MGNSRETILGKIRARIKPYPACSLPKPVLHVSPLEDPSIGALEIRFMNELSKLGTYVYQAADNFRAAEITLQIIGSEKMVLAWDFSKIPLPGLKEYLESSSIYVTHDNNTAARVGISGVDAAFATTGSLVLSSGRGKFRNASILSRVHIALMSKKQIFPDMETWIAKQRTINLEAFKKVSNTVVITGASRTGDITGELIVGMHGPKELHIVIVPDA